MRSQLVHLDARNECHAARSHRHDGVIHVVENRDVQVAEIARKQEGDDLAGTALQHLVPCCPSADDKMNLLRAIPLPDDLLFGPERSDVPKKRRELRLLIIVEVRECTEPGEKWVAVHAARAVILVTKPCSDAEQMTKRFAAPLSLPLYFGPAATASALAPAALAGAGVPRYRFHVFNDDHTVDFEGKELPNLDAAKACAVEGARAIMADEMKSKGKINLSHWIEIEDEQGDMTVVPFEDAVNIIRMAP